MVYPAALPWPGSDDPAGDVAGEMAGEIVGEVAGEVVGEVGGEAAGEVVGEVGEVGGEVAGAVATGDGRGPLEVDAVVAGAGDDGVDDALPNGGRCAVMATMR